MKILGQGRPACGRQAGLSPLGGDRHVSLFVIRRLGRVRAGDFELAGDLFDLNVDQIRPFSVADTDSRRYQLTI